MAFWDKFLKKNSVGVEISSREVKAMLISPAKDGPMVMNAAVEPLPAGTMENGSIAKGDKLAAALSAAVDRLGVGQRRVVSAIPGEHVITRSLKLPQMSKTEVAQTLKWEAEKYIPISEQDLVMEHINFGADSAENQLDILLVAVPRKIVHQYYEIFSLAGLELTAIDIEPLALIRLLWKQVPAEETVSLVDIGASSTDVSVVTGARLEFNRSFNMGADALVDAIANSLMADEKSARQMLWDKVKVPLNDDDPGKQSHLDFTVLDELSRLAHELKRSLDFFNAQSQGRAAQRVFLSGELARLPGLAAYLQQELDINVQLLAPNFTWAAEDMPGQDGGVLRPAWAVTAGLALREVVPHAAG